MGSTCDFDKLIQCDQNQARKKLEENKNEIIAAEDPLVATKEMFNNLFDSMGKAMRQADKKRWDTFMPMIKAFCGDMLDNCAAAPAMVKCQISNEMTTALENVIKEVKEIKQEIGKTYHKPQQSYAAAVLKPKPKKSVFFIRAKDGMEDGKISEKVTKVIGNCKSLRVTDMVKAGNAIKIVTTQQDFNEIMGDELKKDSELSTLEVQNEFKRDPMFEVIIRKDSFEEINDFKTRNGLNEEDEVKLIIKNEFKAKRGMELFKCVYKASPRTFKKLTHSGIIFFNGEAAKLRLFYSLRICTNCWGTDHRKQNCKNSKYCMEHGNCNNGQNCEQPKEKCLLCHKNGLKFDHRTLGEDCHMKLKLLSKERKRTDYGNEL